MLQNPVIVAPEIPMPPMLPPWMTMPPEAIVLISLGFFAASALVLFPFMRAIARRIEGRPGAADPALRDELEQMRGRLAELESVQHRVAELEERVDFAERLLAQRREPERLPGRP